MMTPSYAITATERILPKLALDFTAAQLDSRITFTRVGNTATVTDSTGSIVAINADLPRFDFDPVTLACKGLRIEEARTNLLLNSLLNGTSLSTQTVTVTAAAHTLSFYGAGSVALSGASTATVNGSGAYPTRTTLTFTPSAGSLTLTVTGTVQFAQLELGSFATSFIPTDATIKTRNQDFATLSGTNFSAWFNSAEGAFVIGYNTVVSGCVPFIVDDGTMNNRFQPVAATGSDQFYAISAGGVVFGVSVGATVLNTNQNLAYVYKINSYVFASDASSVVTATGVIPSGLNTFRFGRFLNNTQLFNGWFQKLQYWPQRITNNETRSFSK